ncbi:MAG: CRTAC1 family protein, partial [Terracidiphilus sp.]
MVRRLLRKCFGHAWFPYTAALAVVCALCAYEIPSLCLRSAPVSAAARQNAPQGQTAGGGMASAGPQAAVFDSEHRPITAGGFVKTGPILFQDVAKQAGLTTWHHKAGTAEKKLILEAKGPGVCLLDYNNDGWLD